MTKLLDTVSHPKPAKGYSHPLSTEKLSQALGGVPQFQEITLRYASVEGAALGKAIPGDDTHQLHGAAAGKLDAYRRILECRWQQGEGWSITIDCVPSERKAMVAKAAMEQALPVIRAWLSANKTESWFIGHRHVQVGLSEIVDELALRETHNDRIVRQVEFLAGS